VHSTGREKGVRLVNEQNSITQLPHMPQNLSHLGLAVPIVHGPDIVEVQHHLASVGESRGGGGMEGGGNVRRRAGSVMLKVQLNLRHVPWAA
jgi:hypothetical protein